MPYRHKEFDLNTLPKFHLLNNGGGIIKKIVHSTNVMVLNKEEAYIVAGKKMKIHDL